MNKLALTGNNWMASHSREHHPALMLAFSHLFRVSSEVKRNHRRILAMDVWECLESGVDEAGLKKLIGFGADVNKPNPQTGETPLEVAIKRSLPSNVIQLLLRSGGDPWKTSYQHDGSSLLHFAAKGEDSFTIELLVKAGLKPSLRDAHLDTPLHVAARSNPNLEVVEKMIENDPEHFHSLHLVNERGEVPFLSSLEENPNPAVAGLLAKYGGDLNLQSYDWCPLFCTSRLKWGSEWL